MVRGDRESETCGRERQQASIQVSIVRHKDTKWAMVQWLLRIEKGGGATAGSKEMTARVAKRGDVFQINPAHDPDVFGGAFIVATEIKEWGVQGWCHALKCNSVAYYRVKWEDIEPVGRVVWRVGIDDSEEEDGGGED